MTTRCEDGRFLRLCTAACLAVCCAVSASAGTIQTYPQAKQPPENPAKAATIQAAGLRSLTDPGGYSAPAVAAAAAGLISAIADIRRAQNTTNALAERDLFCSRSSGMARRAKEGDLNSVLDMAQTLILDQRFEEAHALLASVPENHRNSAFYDQFALADEGAGKFERAAESYKRAANTSESETDFFGQGYELLLLGQTAAAEKAFREGLLRNPQSVVLRLGVGATEFLQGRTAEAVRSFLEVARLSPSDPHIYPFLGACSSFAGDQAPQVKAAMKKHLDLSPSDAGAYDLYATVLLQEEPVDSARVEALLTQAIALDTNLADAHFQLGTLYAHHDNPDGAIREFEAVLRLDPRMKEAHYRLASAYRKAGRKGDADGEMKQFRDTRDAGGGIDIVPFISVLDRPGQQPSRQAIPCSTAPH